MALGSFDDAPASLVEALHRAAVGFPDGGITLLDNRGRESSRRTFAECLAGARVGAGRWRELGVGAGEPILICLPTSWEFLDAWLGAILLGALPVAQAPPGALGSPRAQVAKALRICEAIGARRLIAQSTFLDEAERGAAEGALDVGRTSLVSDEAWTRISPREGTDVEPEPGETAFLQLTSGSTGLPRAVEVAHGAAIHNALAIREGTARLDGRPNDHLVSWLPLYHDMGLIGCLTNALVSGTALDLLTPRSFLARPWIWLEAISRRPNVLAPAPNFAYQLCVERVSPERAATLDLGSFRHIMSGSEMVRPETAAAFLEHFRSAGVEPARFRPCYGLAEATLAVTLEARGLGVRTAMVEGADAPTVALGEPIPDHELTILPLPDGNGAPTFDASADLGEERIGRVCVRSPGIMKGYYRDPEATREVLRDGWLDTGDLGFVLDGELYLTGRRKEILILNGTNVMPHEIEWVAEAASSAGGSERCGAFSVLTDRGEAPILVMETTLRDPGELDQLRHELGSAVGRALSMPLEELVLVRRGSIPRTSSGKVQRNTLRRMYLDDELDRVEEPPTGAS